MHEGVGVELPQVLTGGNVILYRTQVGANVEPMLNAPNRERKRPS